MTSGINGLQQQMNNLQRMCLVAATNSPATQPMQTMYPPQQQSNTHRNTRQNNNTNNPQMTYQAPQYDGQTQMNPNWQQ